MRHGLNNGRLLDGLAALLLACTALSKANASEKNEIPYEELKAAGQKYLTARCTPKEIAALEKKLRAQVQTRIQDQGSDEDRVTREIMLEWAASNSGKIRKKDPQAVIQASFFFVRFVEKGFLMPWQIRDSLTPKVVKEILDYLNTEADKAGTKSPKP